MGTHRKSTDVAHGPTHRAVEGFLIALLPVSLNQPSRVTPRRASHAKVELDEDPLW